MATLDLPSWFDASSFEATLVPEVRAFTGVFGGPIEVYDLVADRWRFRVTLPENTYADGAVAEAFFNKLRGGGNWLKLHHLARPTPRGTISGTVTLASSAAQGASSLSLTGMGAGTTLKAGDMLGHNTEQLFQVAEDVTASGGGTATVTLVNRLRKAIASGQTITYSSPQVPFMLTDVGGVPASYAMGISSGRTLEFLEVWTS